MINNIAEQLLSLNNADNKQLLLNDRFICKFAIQRNSHNIFSKFVKDDNCPCESSYADVDVYDKLNDNHKYGRIVIQHNFDLDDSKERYFSSLFMKEAETEQQWTDMFNICNCHINDIS